MDAIRDGVETIICSRDKDLRQCQGYHFTWECGAQPEKSPYLVEGFGGLTPHYDKNGKMDRLYGTGDKWFLAQLLMGDSTDNIPGLKGWGPNKVYALLDEFDDYELALSRVVSVYASYYDQIEGSYWREELEEQAQLVWMIRERNEDGSPKHWRL
jgi:5'-3' exonuclease